MTGNIVGLCIDFRAGLGKGTNVYTGFDNVIVAVEVYNLSVIEDWSAHELFYVATVGAILQCRMDRRRSTRHSACAPNISQITSPRRWHEPWIKHFG
jgi:hypothetical protein